MQKQWNYAVLVTNEYGYPESINKFEDRDGAESFIFYHSNANNKPITHDFGYGEVTGIRQLCTRGDTTPGAYFIMPLK